MKKDYITPKVRVLDIPIEDGFSLSTDHSSTNNGILVGSTENMREGNIILYGDPSNDNGSMMEGVGDIGEYGF